MLKRTLAILAVGAALVATPALAQHHGGGGHFGGGGAHFGGGHFEGGHEHFGGHEGFRGGDRGGHFWHGRWWAYGVGPCWVWTPVGAFYNWVCD